MNNQKHYAAAIAAFVIWGFFTIPLRALQAYTPGEILYYRILFSFVVLLIIIGGFRRKALREDVRRLKTYTQRKRNGVISLTLLGGVLLCVNWLTFIYIVNYINIKTASFSYLICPVLTAVLGYVIIHEKLSRMQWLAVALCSVSCILIGINSALELGFSFLTALTYALYLITQRKNQGFDRMIVLGIQVAFSFLILSALFPFLVTTVPTATEFYSIIMAIAVVFTVLPLFLNLYALNRIDSATIGILMYINPIFNFTLAFILFKESITVIQLFGYLIILVALVVFNYQNFTKLKPTTQA
ncbi:MAG TPA: EamA family transporter [Ohtaekwangia sp.]|nr:EamA family transporter [Ohtaekwangia sp.]